MEWYLAGRGRFYCIVDKRYKRRTRIIIFQKTPKILNKIYHYKHDENALLLAKSLILVVQTISTYIWPCCMVFTFYSPLAMLLISKYEI